MIAPNAVIGVDTGVRSGILESVMANPERLIVVVAFKTVIEVDVHP